MGSNPTSRTIRLASESSVELFSLEEDQAEDRRDHEVDCDYHEAFRNGDIEGCERGGTRAAATECAGDLRDVCRVGRS